MKYYRNKQTGKDMFVAKAEDIKQFVDDAFFNHELFELTKDNNIESIENLVFNDPPNVKDYYAIRGDWFRLPKSAVVIANPDVFAALFEEKKEVPDYQVRMKEEIKQLEDRTNKLNALLDKEKRGELDFVLNCPVWMLEKQLKAMQEYLGILYGRCVFEKVSLEKEKVNGEQN